MYLPRNFFRYVPLCLLIVSVIWFFLFLVRPIPEPYLPIKLNVKNGENWSSISPKLVELGILKNPDAFIFLVKILGKSKKLKAGNYEFNNPPSPFEVLTKLTSGDFAAAKITFPEGITFNRMRELINSHPYVNHQTTEISNSDLLRQLKIDFENPEGLFSPNTYNFTAGTPDVVIFELAYQTQKRVLKKLWSERIDGLPIKTPYEALILASIIEKETGVLNEQAKISEVFINRLNKRIRLQADPTVIYGLGHKFDGNLRKKDLKSDTPYNTYTRFGLPPTPISLPGESAIKAVLNPTKTGNLYFVARGDGTHYFSKTLKEHNKAVNKYQRKK